MDLHESRRPARERFAAAAEGEAVAATRRRGAQLEEALLDAAWELLQEVGYQGFTFDAVAARAGTSRPVLYRRWRDKTELLFAVIQHAKLLERVDLPDTGSIREDIVTLLRRVTAARSGNAALLSVLMGEYFRETGSSYAELRERMFADRPNGPAVILERARSRGEMPDAPLPETVVELPSTLFRFELLVSYTISEERIRQIVDDIWLPLLRQYGVRV